MHCVVSTRTSLQLAMLWDSSSFVGLYVISGRLEARATDASFAPLQSMQELQMQPVQLVDVPSTKSTQTNNRNCNRVHGNHGTYMDVTKVITYIVPLESFPWVTHICPWLSINIIHLKRGDIQTYFWGLSSSPMSFSLQNSFSNVDFYLGCKTLLLLDLLPKLTWNELRIRAKMKNWAHKSINISFPLRLI